MTPQPETAKTKYDRTAQDYQNRRARTEQQGQDGQNITARTCQLEPGSFWLDSWYRKTGTKWLVEESWDRMTFYRKAGAE